MGICVNLDNFKSGKFLDIQSSEAKNYLIDKIERITNTKYDFHNNENHILLNKENLYEIKREISINIKELSIKILCDKKVNSEFYYDLIKIYNFIIDNNEATFFVS